MTQLEIDMEQPPTRERAHYGELTGQNFAIYERLKEGGWLTPLEAMLDPSIKSMKLSTRIGEIQQWLPTNEWIEKKWEQLPSGKRVMAYRLVVRLPRH